MVHKLIYSSLILCAFAEAPALAIQSYDLVDHQRTEVTVSTKQLNRIAIKGDRIQQIFGADDYFHIETDDQGGQIFLKFFAAETNTPVSLTIITEAGLTQDLKLVPQNIDAQTIFFKPKFSSEDKEEKDFVKSRDEEITELIQAMANDQRLEDFEVKNLGKEKVEYKNVFMPLKQYKGSLYQGTIYQIKNKSEESWTLREEDFIKSDDIAACLSQSLVAPGETVELYVVQKQGEMS